MCDTRKCHACRPAKASSGFGTALLLTFDAAAMALVWLITRTARRVVWPGLILAGWAAWVWFSGRTWRHAVRRRLLRREVRAAANWAVTAAVLGFLVAPLLTAAVLATAGVGLLAAASTIRHREQLRQLAAGRFPRLDSRGPIRVRAVAGPTRRLPVREGR